MNQDQSHLETSNPKFWRYLDRSQIRSVSLFAAGVVVAFVALLIYRAFFPPPVPLNQTDVEAQVVAIMASATPQAAYSALVYQVILPSLVIIQSTSENNDIQADEHANLEADLDKKSGGGVGIGTGVVVSANGDILTAYHVVDQATEISLIFADGSEALADIVVAQPENDIAVLQPRSAPGLIVPAVLGNPNAMRVGDEAYAVGNPLGLVGSMSEGVISGFNRSLPLPGSDERLEGLIQFDAAVNPGNSGGPLLNRAGQVIGIVTALVNPSEQNFFIGIGFAVPIETAGGAAGMPGY